MISPVQGFHNFKRKRELRKLQHQVNLINRMEPEIAALSDDQLRDRFRRSDPFPHHRFTPIPERLIVAFACIREAVKRAKNMRPYDVQVMAGLVMAKGQLAEMATGEGKTLVATLPAAVLALAGKGVHVATVNAYLAKRDYELMSPVYEFLGLTVGLLKERDSQENKRAAYQADITYGTGYEFGFDFLRDQLLRLGFHKPRLGQAWQESVLRWKGLSNPEPVQRPFAFAVIDEIDSVLIDEAVTPLIISRPAPEGESPDAEIYRQANQTALDLIEEEDYDIHVKERQLRLTRQGMEKLYAQRPVFETERMRRAWHEYVEQALRARYLHQKDVHYLIRKQAVEIIDENTGRSFPDRKWRSGLHQAVEAKESVLISSETESDVTISRQRFYRLYPFLCGMSGTASEEEIEFQNVYGLRVIPILRHKPLQRIDLPDRVFATNEAKLSAIVNEVKQSLDVGRPVLIGTRTVRRSDELARALKKAGIHYALLNARQDEEEAEIIALAGLKGRVTIATNMAGRGADIPLGEGVAELGGLHVIGEERNESRRIDRQLSGRSGRQGDPGSSQYFLSYEDDLLKKQPRQPSDPDRELPPESARIFLQAQLQRERDMAAQRDSIMREDQWLAKLKRHA